MRILFSVASVDCVTFQLVMSKKLTVYQKPTCTKCRQVIKILRDREADFDAINYYEKPFTEKSLSALLAKLKLSPRDILRADEPIARELGLSKKEFSDAELIRLMVKHPDLIQRPIAVCGNDAVLARPPENVEKLL